MVFFVELVILLAFIVVRLPALMRVEVVFEVINRNVSFHDIKISFLSILSKHGFNLES
jgi:hypothetical protein